MGKKVYSRENGYPTMSSVRIVKVVNDGYSDIQNPDILKIKIHYVTLRKEPDHDYIACSQPYYHQQ